MKKAKKVFSRVMAVLTVLIFLFGLIIFVSVLRAKNGQIPSFAGYSVLQIMTGSMEPEYKTGCIVVVHKVDTDTLKKGDVISFYSTDKNINGRVNTHRIYEVTSNMKGVPLFVTKGDANAEPDPETVSSINVIGKVVFNLGTVSGSVISVLRNPKVIFFLIILPLIFITFSEAFNLVSMIVENRSEEKEETDEEQQDDKN